MNLFFIMIFLTKMDIFQIDKILIKKKDDEQTTFGGYERRI